MNGAGRVGAFACGAGIASVLGRMDDAARRHIGIRRLTIFGFENNDVADFAGGVLWHKQARSKQTTLWML